MGETICYWVPPRQTAFVSNFPNAPRGAVRKRQQEGENGTLGLPSTLGNGVLFGRRRYGPGPYIIRTRSSLLIERLPRNVIACICRPKSVWTQAFRDPGRARPLRGLVANPLYSGTRRNVPSRPVSSSTPEPRTMGPRKNSGKAACGGLPGAVWPEADRTHNHLRKRLTEGTGRSSPSAHSGPLRQTRRVNYPIW